MWSVENAKLVRTFRGRDKSVTSLAFSPDGAHILTADSGKLLRVVDLASGVMVESYQVFDEDNDDVKQVSFSPDGCDILYSTKKSKCANIVNRKTRWRFLVLITRVQNRTELLPMQSM